MSVHRHDLYATLLCQPRALSYGQYIVVTALPKAIQIILHCPVDVRNTMYICVDLWREGGRKGGRKGGRVGGRRAQYTCGECITLYCD